ncbi:ABC transporter ATP-binding protein [Terricaulis silvestris]|uniref:Lipoprotein-releasing system ATP-binding protein LolD n=1 Tax=Terricaulis silvestris TaxID=2686094 RepID=A0A6I6MPB6_9CAUL|nr:ABC transporter ATP-binding protein [Terricaulis silvestris]QGZ95218.1 Lipoprotein-releasing system ATP-binding protein LolD [Terricaulis silvestris]
MSNVAPVLTLKDLSRRYQSGEDELVVLDKVDLHIMPGEIVGLIGPSGSGKSSLLHAAGMLERPSGGDVLIEGHSGWSANDEQRTGIRRNRIGFVYQFHHLLPEFDAIHNVALPALIAGRPRREALAEAERLLGVLNLGHRLRHQPAQLSGGEQQRVAIARAMINNPVLILADEPTGNLDPDTSTVVFAALSDLVRNEGAAALIATHNLELAKYMDRVMSVDHGHLVQKK